MTVRDRCGFRKLYKSFLFRQASISMADDGWNWFGSVPEDWLACLEEENAAFGRGLSRCPMATVGSTFSSFVGLRIRPIYLRIWWSSAQARAHVLVVCRCQLPRYWPPFAFALHVGSDRPEIGLTLCLQGVDFLCEDIVAGGTQSNRTPRKNLHSVARAARTLLAGE